MEDKDVSKTNQIYAELMDGLKTGLDWPHFLAKHSDSKGPTYNAIGRFLNDMEPRVRKLNEVQAELEAAGLKLDEAGLRLEQLDRQVREAESSLAPLEDRRNALDEQIETLESKLAEKSEVIKQVVELEKHGFDIERLRHLKDALTEIGAKSGLKGKEAVAKFFDELKDYDVTTGFEREIQRLETITGTKKLEADKWQEKADSLSRRHKDLSEAIIAVQSLTRQRVDVGDIVSWNGVVNKLGGPEELEKELGDYKTMRELLNAKKEEAGSYKLRITKAKSQVETLEKERVKIEGAIEAMAEATQKQLKAVAASEIKEVQDVAREIRSKFATFLTQLDKLLEKAVHLGQEIERSKQELQNYEGVKAALESHAVAAEEVK